MTGEWARMHNEELRDLYCRMIKSRKVRWAWNVARMEGKSCVQGLGGGT